MDDTQKAVPEFQIRKSVDESWKEAAEQEKHELHHTEADAASVEPNFSFFVASLAMQTLMFLGEIDNPATGQKQTDVAQAQYLIETLAMLAEKTKGNLTEEEKAQLDEALYGLRVKFVEKMQKP